MGGGAGATAVGLRVAVGDGRHLRPAPGRPPDRRARPGQHALHDHERVQRDGHERRRRQRGGGPQHDQAQLALHRARPAAGGGPGAAGGRQQRPGRHPHGAERLRGPAHLGRGHRRPAVRAGDQRGGGAFATPAEADGGRLRPGVTDRLPRRHLREPRHRGGQRGGAAARSTPSTSTASCTPPRPRGARCWPPPCTSCPPPRRRSPCPTAHSCSGTAAPRSCGTGTTSPTMPLEITGYPPVPGRLDPPADARTCPWSGRSRWPGARWRSSRPTSRSWRRPSWRPEGRRPGRKDESPPGDSASGLTRRPPRFPNLGAMAASPTWSTGSWPGAASTSPLRTGLRRGGGWRSPRCSPSCSRWRPTRCWSPSGTASVPGDEGLRALPVRRLRQADRHRRAHRRRGLARRGPGQLTRRAGSSSALPSR